ncbi:MAG: DUF4091 domain-containing protein [Thermoguttaceae bacterium]|nr:DUF4091 domain-containing protein [Thermoguttaceae bacterium]
MTRPFFRIAVSALFALLSLSSVSRHAGAEEALTLWPVDIHTRIFGDTPAGDAAPIALSAARNEYESGQFGILSPADLENVTLSVSDLAGPDSAVIPAERVRLRPIGTVPLRHNTQYDSTVVRTAPCDFPDILYEETTVSLKAGEALGVWVTVFVPAETAAGSYSGTITVKNSTAEAALPLTLEVFPFTLPEERHLWVTNWFDMHKLAAVHNVEFASDAYWEVLEKYFRNMAEHRQNTVWINELPGSLVRATRKSDGTWDIDFSRMQKFIEVAEKCGVGQRLEFFHCAWVDRTKHELVFLSVRIFDEAKGEDVEVPGTVWVPEVLGALEKWLIDTGRIDKSMIHIADEPFREDMASWREVSEFVHRAAPRIKRIDAIESTHFSDDLEVWVPKLSHYERWKDMFNHLRCDDHEMWFYICCHPFGKYYPNRFIDIPATRVRAIHWVNYTEHLCGYLHWGYNFWAEDPFGAPSQNLPPGDTHCVYPGPLDSIRWEIERESIEDYEYFLLLQRLTEEAAQNSGADLWWLDPETRSMELAHRALPSMTEVNPDPEVFRQAREDTAREISAMVNGPKLIVRSCPGDGQAVTVGPFVIEYYGLTDPGAAVTVDGNEIPVAEDGTFQYSAQVFDDNGGKDTFKNEFTATLDGKTTKTVRVFPVRLP